MTTSGNALKQRYLSLQEQARAAQQDLKDWEKEHTFQVSLVFEQWNYNEVIAETPADAIRLAQRAFDQDPEMAGEINYVSVEGPLGAATWFPEKEKKYLFVFCKGDDWDVIFATDDIAKSYLPSDGWVLVQKLDQPCINRYLLEAILAGTFNPAEVKKA